MIIKECIKNNIYLAGKIKNIPIKYIDNNKVKVLCSGNIIQLPNEYIVIEYNEDNISIYSKIIIDNKQKALNKLRDIFKYKVKDNVRSKYKAKIRYIKNKIK